MPTTRNQRQFLAPTGHVPRSMSLVGRLDSLLSRILIMMAPLEQQS
jgi:hypothetical protein